jgi:uncharacterized membrane protein YhdT
MDVPMLAGTGIVILGLVVWIVCAIQAHKLARKKHRSVPLWTALAIIFGPIAYFGLYVLPQGR